MKLSFSFFFILLISISILLIFNPQPVEAISKTVRGVNYIDVDNGDGTHTWSSAPEWILDNGVYKPYKLFEDSSVVKVETMQGSFIFDKNSCALSFYNSGVIGGQQPTIGSDRYIALGTTLGNQNFVKVNSINNAACQTTVIESGNDIEVRGTKHVDNVGTFKIRYIKNDGQDLKTQLEPTNENPAWTNHKLGITQTIQVPQMITLGDTTYNLANFNGTVLDRQWLIDHKGQLSKLSEKINFDFGLGFQYVEKITIFWDGTKAGLIIDYWYNTPQISPGQTLIIDPIFGYSTGTLQRVTTSTATGAACPTASFSKSTVTHIIDLAISTNNGDCDVLSYRWDISSLPGSTTVTNATFRYDITGATNARNCDFNDIQTTHDPDTASAATLWNDITNSANGTTYVNNDAGCTTVSNDKVIDLGTTADSNIEASLGVDFFAIGILYDSMTRDASSHQTTFAQPELQITYTTTTQDAVTDLSALQVTGTDVNLDWSQPDLHGNTLTGYQINYTTPWGNPQTIITNNTGNSNTAGTISGLTELTDYSFRVSAWTELGTNATGKILNITTLRDFSFGSLNLTATNTDLIPMRFERNDINDTALFLNVTYSSSFTLACDLHYKFAMTNQTYHSVASTTIGTEKHSAFQFIDIDNEIVDVFCWNESAGNMLNNTNVNSTNSGRYIITQTNFQLLEQIQNFKAGEFGTFGQFGVIDIVTFFVIILSMVGLNRVNESVGGIFVVAVVGVCWFFGIIDLANFIASAIALTVLLIVGSTKKD